MGSLTVRPVQTWRQRRRFLNFPWTLYRNDPHWIPPLRVDQKELVGYATHPFYEENEVQTFLAYRSGEVCGRIAAIVNHAHNRQHHERRGFFGFFECRDDEDAARGLFDAAREWFASREIAQLRGPVNPSLNYTVGLLVEGFDSSPFFMMTYNPPYYSRLIERSGFEKSQDLYSYWGHIDMLPAIAAKLAPIAEQIIDHIGARLRPLDTSRFQEDVEGFLSIYNRSLVNTWGFVPMSPGEVHHTAKTLRFLIVPELVMIVEIDGKMAGAAFALPDYNPRIREIDGRLFPFGFWKLLRRKHEIKRFRVLSANVLPEYQRLGVGLVLMHGLVPKTIQWGIQEAEFSWVLESNSLSRRSLEKGGAKRTKTYRIYDSADATRS
jgi:GNAT superfamily N-acetyltransferase